MSLDDLITLLLVVLFVGAPLLRRFLGRGGGQAGQSRPSEGGGDAASPARPQADQPPSGAGSGESARADRGAAAASRDADRPASDFERTLAEARRRVREAREGAPARSGDRKDAGGRRRQAPDRRVWEEPPKPLVKPRTSTDSGFLGREGIREPRPKTAPLKVQRRRRKRRGSTLSSAHDVVSVRPRDIMRGIVWHQILSEPVSKRPPRRKPSRVR